MSRAWDVLDTVLDPEVPALSVCDLGIVRDVIEHDDGLEVVLTPTYSGCPATEVIERSVIEALESAGLGPARVTLRRAPAWTTDWISEAGKRKLAEYGIAPPGSATKVVSFVGWAGLSLSKAPHILSLSKEAHHPRLTCPHCHSTNTERLSAFGSTACKSLHRCLSCREPFEHFKAI